MANKPLRCSVIVPVFNAGEHVAHLLDALDKQTLPREQFEIVLVDNNSTDHLTSFHLDAASEQGTTVLQETEYQSTYAARNRGVEASRAPVLVFTDADAIPRPNWLEAGLAALDETRADLLGGSVVPLIRQPPSLSEVLDVCTWLDQHYYIQWYNFAATANLFVRRNVFDAIGLFDPHLVSNGDYAFCKWAQAEGFTLRYGADAIVDHPCRATLAEVRRKALRVGYGHGQRTALYRDGNPFFLDLRLYFPAPPRFSRARQLNIRLSLWRVLWLWMMNYFAIRLSYVIGSYRGYKAERGSPAGDAGDKS